MSDVIHYYGDLWCDARALRRLSLVMAYFTGRRLEPNPTTDRTWDTEARPQCATKGQEAIRSLVMNLDRLAGVDTHTFKAERIAGVVPDPFSNERTWLLPWDESRQLKESDRMIVLGIDGHPLSFGVEWRQRKPSAIDGQHEWKGWMFGGLVYHDSAGHYSVHT